MFFFNPELAAQGEDDEEGGEAIDYRQLSKEDEDEDGIQYREIVLDDIALEASEADNTGSVAAENRLKDLVVATESKVNGTAEGKFKSWFAEADFNVTMLQMHLLLPLLPSLMKTSFWTTTTWMIWKMT